MIAGASQYPVNLDSIGCEYIDEEPECGVNRFDRNFRFFVQPYSAISTGVAGPASGLSSISTMHSDAATIMAAAARNT
jgi:hypothetical protein